MLYIVIVTVSYSKLTLEFLQHERKRHTKRERRRGKLGKWDKEEEREIRKMG